MFFFFGHLFKHRQAYQLGMELAYQKNVNMKMLGKYIQLYLAEFINDVICVICDLYLLC